MTKVRPSLQFHIASAEERLVSMVDGDLFDKLARLGSILRKKTEPFGGIQVMVHAFFRGIRFSDNSIARRHWGFLSATTSYEGLSGQVCI